MTNDQTTHQAVAPQAQGFWKLYASALLLGVFGVHRFLVGKTATGLVQALTCGGFGIWTLVDVVMLLAGRFTDRDGRVVRNTSPAASWALFVLLALVTFARPSAGKPGTASNRSRVDDPPAPAAGASPTRAVPVPAVILPEEETRFIEVIAQFRKRYEAAPNELKKSALRDDRRQAIAGALSSLEFKGWVGVIKSMTTTGDGNAHLEIELGNAGVVIQNNNNEVSAALGDTTLIPKGSELYAKVAELSEGQRVVVSGRFFKGDKDYLVEESVTEKGSMTEPEFKVKYTAVEKP